MKKTNVFLKFCLLLLCVGLSFTACQNDQQDLTQQIDEQKALTVDPKQSLEVATMEVLFAHLSQQANLKDLSVHDQIMILNDFAKANNLFLDLQPAIESYEAAPAKFQYISPDEEFIIAEIKQLNQLIETHGYNARLSNALQAYRDDFIASTQHLALDANSFNIVIGMIDQADFMASNPVMQNYLQQINPQFVSGNAQERVSFQCWLARISLAAALASCALNPFACAGIPFAIWTVTQECGSEYVDPCLNSPNPCCGITCIQGYICNSSGNCVEDTSYDCNITGCLPGEQCLNGLCVPF